MNRVKPIAIGPKLGFNKRPIPASIRPRKKSEYSQLIIPKPRRNRPRGSGEGRAAPQRSQRRWPITNSKDRLRRLGISTRSLRM